MKFASKKMSVVVNDLDVNEEDECETNDSNKKLGPKMT